MTVSFAQNVKEELLARPGEHEEPEKTCCHHAEQYGLFLFCRSFSAGAIVEKTELERLAGKFAEAVEECCGHTPEAVCSAAGNWSISVPDPADRLRILESFGYSGTEVTRRLNRANLEFDCDYGAFLRGAFLSCGTITDPEKDYHVEFVLSHKVLCEDLMTLLSEIGFQPKYIRRNGSHVVYFKDSESIEDLLTIMGATESSLDLMGTKIYKDMRNKVNRRMNFENANSSRAFDAAYKQVEAIRYIQEKRGWEYFPHDLRELARIRLDNVDYSLKELAGSLETPISKSGVNHRMKKILELYEDLKDEERRNERMEATHKTDSPES